LRSWLLFDKSILNPKVANKPYSPGKSMPNSIFNERPFFFM